MSVYEDEHAGKGLWLLNDWKSSNRDWSWDSQRGRKAYRKDAWAKLRINAAEIGFCVVIL